MSKQINRKIKHTISVNKKWNAVTTTITSTTLIKCKTLFYFTYAYTHDFSLSLFF